MEIKSGYSYLRVIYSLIEDKKEVSTNNIANALGVKPASVTEMIHKLTKDSYILHKPYKNITLTKKGEKEAIKAIRRHRLIEDFLTRVLKINNKPIPHCEKKITCERCLAGRG